MTPRAPAAVLARTLSAMPARERDCLLPGPGSAAVPASAMTDAEWLREQLRLRGLRWRTSDPRVLATLWWYSASVWVQCPALASLVVTGDALSPCLPDVALHWWPDSRITGATSARVLDGADPVAALAGALRETFAAVIGPLARIGRMKERPLWAIATDSMANRLLWMGKATGDVEHATGLAARLGAAIGPPLPVPRYVQVGTPPAVRFTRRCSCCLLYEAPGQDMCSSCPKRDPAERQRRLERAARTGTAE